MQDDSSNRLTQTPSHPRFLALTSDSAPLSPRGQHLQGLIQSRSSSNLNDLRFPGGASSARSLKENRYERADDADLELARTPTKSSWWYHQGPNDSYTQDAQFPRPPPGFPLKRGSVIAVPRDTPRKHSVSSVLMTPQLRSQRLIGNSNPRYRWERYWSTDEELKKMKGPLRKYYERNNYLIQQYLYIDRILDSSLPHTLIQEYNNADVAIPETIPEHATPSESDPPSPAAGKGDPFNDATPTSSTPTNGFAKVKRTPRDIYKVPDNEDTPLLSSDGNSIYGPSPEIPTFDPDDDGESSQSIVTLAIYINMAANTVLLILKIIVMALTSSLSVLASLVDAALDFLSTGIVWTTTHLISHADKDTQNYPVGRRRLEPIGVLVFSVIMITSFFQVALESFNALAYGDHKIVELSVPAVVIMATTVGVKGACWLWCRLIRNSSVQALAQDAMTDVSLSASTTECAAS